MSMSDTLVSFETAKLAKEKGFNYGCLYHFISDSNMKEYYKPYIKFQYDLSSEVNNLKPLSNDSFNKYKELNLSGKLWCWSNAIAAPTQSLLQKWLRDIHNIHVDIHAGHYAWNNKNSYLRSVYKIIGKNTPNKYVSYRVKEVETYEEALEKGLQEALKLIK